MELLQNRRYKPDDISISYYNEIKLQIESIIEVCREGNISVHETVKIIYSEMECSMDYIWSLYEMLESLEKEKQEPIDNEIENESVPDYIDTSWYPSTEDLLNVGYEFRKKELEKALEDMEKYHDSLVEIEGELAELLESPDYQKKRKENIRQQIITNGLQLTAKNNEEANEQTSKNNVTDRSLNYLITSFPQLSKDYKLLSENGYLKITDKGLRWLKTKQSLAEYFKSIKPTELKRIPWTMIGKIFGEKDLKNSASANGNEFKGTSADFTGWLKIKSTP
jgi:hypothetical protein